MKVSKTRLFRLAAMAAACVMLMSACKTAGSASGGGSGDEDEEAAANGTADAAAFDKVYTQARSKLDLGGDQTYIVQSGDTLTAITKQYYGDDKGYYFPMIMAASSNVVTNPDLISPGMELTIPDFDANMNEPKIRKMLKGVFKKVAKIYADQGKTSMEEPLSEIAEEL